MNGASFMNNKILTYFTINKTKLHTFRLSIITKILSCGTYIVLLDKTTTSVIYRFVQLKLDIRAHFDPKIGRK